MIIKSLLRSTILLFASCLASNLLLAQSLLIKNVNIIDGTGSSIQLSKNVLINDGRIQSIFNEGDLDISSDIPVLDADGSFLIPGLWDMHVHWYDATYLPLFVANGVTGTRQMWGMNMHYKWRDRENRDGYIGPKTVIASVILDGSPKIWPDSIEVTNEKQARKQVKKFHRRGADFIKVYKNLNREAYFAIADESKRLGIPFAGHVPDSVKVAEASAAGQKSIEHLTKIDLETSDTYIETIQEYRGRGVLTGQTALEFMQKVYEGYGGDKTSNLYQRFVENGTWQSPTLTVSRNLAYIDERPELDRERLTYLSKQTTDRWIAKSKQLQESRTPEDWTREQLKFKHFQKIVGDMHAAGVKIIAGTDVLNPFCFPGFSLHDELFLLVESGLSPMAALQAATKNAAEFSGRLADLGTIEEGKIADLVLLDANPLEDIRNTTKISSVVLNGILHDRNALSEMLRTVRKSASVGRKWRWLFK